MELQVPTCVHSDVAESRLTMRAAAMEGSPDDGCGRVFTRHLSCPGRLPLPTCLVRLRTLAPPGTKAEGRCPSRSSDGVQGRPCPDRVAVLGDLSRLEGTDFRPHISRVNVSRTRGCLCRFRGVVPRRAGVYRESRTHAPPASTQGWHGLCRLGTDREALLTSTTVMKSDRLRVGARQGATALRKGRSDEDRSGSSTV